MANPRKRCFCCSSRPFIKDMKTLHITTDPPRYRDLDPQEMVLYLCYDCYRISSIELKSDIRFDPGSVQYRPVSWSEKSP